MERLRHSITVSVVAPAFNERDNLRALYEEIRTVLESAGCNFEIVIVDNGSGDGSLELLRTLRDEDSRIGFVSLSRNFGHQGGLLAGLAHCRGNVVVSMDADLQHPPSVIVDMLECWEKGFDVVSTNRLSAPGTTRVRRILNWAFYAGIGRLAGVPPTQGQSDFRLMDRRALEALLALPEKDKFVRGLASWIGFRQTQVSFVQGRRHAGKSKFGLVHLVGFTLNGIAAFSILPLRIFTVTGFIVAASSFVYGLYVLLSALLLGTDALPRGWSTLAVGIFFLGGVQLMGIGVLGEYLGRTLAEVRGRPAYVVREADIGPATDETMLRSGAADGR